MEQGQSGIAKGTGLEAGSLGDGGVRGTGLEVTDPGV
jgi:hypothetical protein